VRYGKGCPFPIKKAVPLPRKLLDFACDNGVFWCIYGTILSK